MPGLEVHAADLDPAAVRCARRNVEGEVYEGDLFDALPPSLRGRAQTLLVNTPYVPTGEIALLPPEARDHERPSRSTAVRTASTCNGGSRRTPGSG